MQHGHSNSIDTAHDLLRGRHGPLDVFVRPMSVALVGATDRMGSVGRRLAENLLKSAPRRELAFINPTRSTVLGRRCFPCLTDVPPPVDLVVIAVAARSVPDVIAECLAAGARGAIVVSAGFKEIGAEGVALESQIRQLIAGTRLRVIGPNCLGVMSPSTGLNASFAAAMARQGNLGFITQSGALLTAILDWSLAEKVGFSHVFSVGSMLDVGWGDLIDFLGDDPHTSSILLYMESIGNANAFLSAAREVALQKPIIVIKAGRTETAAKAAASHTGALAGSDEVLAAAFRRVGVVQVRRMAELFNLAEALAKQPRPKGPHLAVVTNAGGPGVLAVDALIESGGQLATLSPETLAALNQLLPPHWSHGNPVDVLGDATPECYARCLQIIAEAPECDGILALLAPQAMTDPTDTAFRITDHPHFGDKPILANWMGGSQVTVGIDILNNAGIPTYAYPDSAARTFQYMWQYSYALKALYETPVLNHADENPLAAKSVGDLLQGVLKTGRILLTEPESKQVLAAYGIPSVETAVAQSAGDAVQCARKIGYPVVLKLLSTTITHKIDVGGVKLNLQSDEEVAAAYDAISNSVQNTAGLGHFDGVTVQPMVRRSGYELILGSKVDPQFGPVLLFGSGGQLVEVYRDRALGLPPLTSTLARRMMERTKIYCALKGIRGQKPVDLTELEQILVRFGQLVLEQPRISEIDINPLLASGDELLALDARVVMHPGSCTEADLPRPVIRPYPRQYIGHWSAADGRKLTIRPIRPEDEPLLKKFHGTLSAQSVYARYAQALSLNQRVMHERLARMCFIDYDRQIALVALDEQSPESRIVGVARLIKLHGTPEAEFAVIVADAYQRLGLGRHLMEQLGVIARDEKQERMIGQISASNRAMLSICQRMGFELVDSPDGTTRYAALKL